MSVKYSGLNLFLVLIFCIGINFEASIANGSIFNIFDKCYEALSKKALDQNIVLTVIRLSEKILDSSIEKSIQLAFEKTKATFNDREFTKKQSETDLMRAAKLDGVSFVLEIARKHTLKLGLEEIGAQLVFTIYVNEANSNGMTALMYASSNGHREAVITLVRVGAQVDIKDKNNITASAHAASNGHYDIAEMLANKEDILRELGRMSHKSVKFSYRN